MSKICPSNTDFDWLYANRKKNAAAYPEHTEQGGKWMIFISCEDIDRIWALIKSAVIRCELGDEAKVSGEDHSNPYNRNKEHVICVYTYDFEDKQDVLRIGRQVCIILGKAGCHGVIKYKMDVDTYANRYANNTGKPISKMILGYGERDG